MKIVFVQPRDVLFHSVVTLAFYIHSKNSQTIYLLPYMEATDEIEQVRNEIELEIAIFACYYVNTMLFFKFYPPKK